jgi:cell wall-associated NlpC family hydrolase
MNEQEFLDYCNQFVGLPYVWGADGPDAYDCSGLVQTLLARIGLDPEGDDTAQDLYRHFKQQEYGSPVQSFTVGTLLFFGRRRRRISHVAMALGADYMIEAAGGGPDVTTIEQANDAGAQVKISPTSSRGDLIAAFTPLNLPWTG